MHVVAVADLDGAAVLVPTEGERVNVVAADRSGALPADQLVDSAARARQRPEGGGVVYPAHVASLPKSVPPTPGRRNLPTQHPTYVLCSAPMSYPKGEGR